MNQLTDTVYTAYVGIDWADAKHDICVQVAGSEGREFDRMVHKPERIEAWARAMVQRFGGPKPPHRRRWTGSIRSLSAN